MAYALGIDVGTTFTAAAILRDGIVEVFPLATNQVAVPSVIFATGDEMLFAAPAERRGATQPLGLAREFKRRLGDPVPLMLSGSPYHADRLTALMAKWVVDSVTAQVGSAPSSIVLTHPANWTEYQLGTLRNALADVGLSSAGLVSEPAAAALDFSAVAAVDPGSSVLVYDLGGGTFDVALLQRTGAVFDHQIEPAGIERLGGIDFDEAVFQYVVASIPAQALEAARQHPDGAGAIAALRRRCVDAKEALSSDATTDVPVMLPGYTSTVRITRAEFEDMIRPMVRQTIELVESTLARAQIDAPSLGAVLLVGGSSRIPLIPQMVSEQLHLPVRVDAHPKLVVAKGAARYADVALPATKPTRPRVVHDYDDDEDDEGRRPLAIVGALVVLALVLAGAGYWFLLRDGEESATPDATLGSEVLDSVPATAKSVPSSTEDSTPETASPSTAVTTGPTEPVEAPFVPYAVGAEFATLPGPIDLELVGNDLWVMSEQAGALQRFDVTNPSPTALEQVDLGFTLADGRNGNDVIAVDGALFVTQQEAGTVAHVDLTTPERTVQRITVPGDPINGAVVGTTLLVTTRPPIGTGGPGQIVPIDIPTLTVGTPIPMPEMPYGIVSTGDGIWVTFDDADRIGKVDLTTGDVEFVEGLEEPTDSLAVGDDLWVSLAGADQVAVVDRATGVVRRYVPVGFTPFKLVEGMGSVWVTNAGSAQTTGSVSRLSPTSRDMRALQDPIPLLNAPIEMAVGEDRIFVANYGSATVSVLAPSAEGATTTSPG